MTAIRLGTLVAVVSWLLPSPAPALVGACFTGPFPTTPVAPVTGFTVTDGPTIPIDGELWRQPCADGSGQIAALVRLTPVDGGGPTVCKFEVIQDGASRPIALVSSAGGAPFCGPLTQPAAFLFRQAAGQPSFDAARSFIVNWDWVFDAGHFARQFVVPDYAPPPILIVPLAIQRATCSATCRPGDTLGFDAQVSNTGGPITVEMKAGVRVSDGTVIGLVNELTELPAGQTMIPLVPAITVPPGVPALELIVETAVLEPLLGVTLSRNGTRLQVLP